MKLRRIITSAAVAAAALCIAGTSAFASTAFYVGKDASMDGSVMLGRTEDNDSASCKRFIVHPAADHEKGELYTTHSGFSMEYPEHTFRYSALPNSANEEEGEYPYGAGGFNEYGVAATSTVSADPSEKAIEADPYTETGLREYFMNDLILSRVTTARAGVELLARLIDEQGAGEGSIIMIADEDEAWYMEIYTGHQYAAIRLPDDKAAVIPNIFMLRDFDPDAKDVIASKELVSLPEEKGFLKQKNGGIDLYATYAAPISDYSSYRIWGGRKLLNGNPGTDPAKLEVSLLYSPTKKLAVKDIMNAMRYRYEDTKYNLSAPGNKYIRAIGTARQEECHILQIRPELEREISCVEWLCMGNCEFEPFVPYYASAITDTPYIAKLDAPEYSPYSMYWASRSLSALAAQNRTLYGHKIKQFMSDYEDQLIKGLADNDKAMSRTKKKNTLADELCADNAYAVYDMQRAVYSKLVTFLAEYEGEEEEKGNKLQFELKIKQPKAAAAYAELPDIVTIKEGAE